MSSFRPAVQTAASPPLYGEVASMTASPSRQNYGSRSAVLEPCIIGLGRFLRSKHPRDTAAYVAAETNIPIESVENWLQGRAFPRAKHQFRLIAAYGPSVFAAMMPSAPRWLDEAVRAERLRELEETQARLAREAEELRSR
jgi:hypothetical protein